MSPAGFADVDALLAPVAGAAPSGADLRYLPIFDEIKAARRLAEADPTEVAPWRKVLELASVATARSKDLQLAIWLLEALGRVEGFRGTATGLLVVRRLLEEYWDSLYPQLDPEDPEPLEFRRALLDWIDDKLPIVFKSSPLTGPPSSFGLIHYEVTQKTGDEKKALLDEGWPSSERFEEALTASTSPHLEKVLEGLTACADELTALQTAVDLRFNDRSLAAGQDRSDPLRFVVLKEAIETARWLVERPLKKRQQAQMPSPPPGGRPSPTAGAPSPATDVATGVSGDQLWTEALTLTRGSSVDGLRLMQTRLAAAASGRERFLRQLQLAELCLEAGMYVLAFPVFDELARVIDARQLEAWEDKGLVGRVWQGVLRCCDLLKAQDPACATREREILDKMARLDSSPTADT
jgi:type VI secretion system protein ImpA